ncbi:hypothetical protein AVEN_122995-1 [Araneus ventricosus]|uniref:Uncharacterized protein n=1 Tax=Araneus ventricosus TaxID=182803 RepID=A0A4Y2CUD5_ARAVE|nr:hypothetical protein AVEN_122995-1 [Araneus ventricosus]
MGLPFVQRAMVAWQEGLGFGPIHQKTIMEEYKIENSVSVTLSLDDDEIIENVLGKEIEDDGEAEDEDGDDMQTKKVTWKEPDERLQTFIRFAKECSSMSQHDVCQYLFQCAQ